MMQSENLHPGIAFFDAHHVAAGGGSICATPDDRHLRFALAYFDDGFMPRCAAAHQGDSRRSHPIDDDKRSAAMPAKGTDEQNPFARQPYAAGTIVLDGAIPQGGWVLQA